jgi:predicted transcriptional regulator
MREIMISIQPQFVEKILNKEKTIEIRKTMPKCELPCKVYIYCTKHNNYKNSLYLTDDDKYDVDYYVPSDENFILNGKVVAEFTLNKVKEYGYVYSPAMLMQGYYTKKGKELDYSKTCLKLHEIEKYADDGHTLPKPIYAWHIDNLKIYDKPKELSGFLRWNRTEENSPCANVKALYPTDCKKCMECKLTKPPKSWCYVQRGNI